MTRHSSHLLALIVIAMLFASVGVYAAETPAPAPVQEVSSLDADLDPPAQAQTPSISFETPLQVALSAAAYECPAGQAYCWKDSQCNAPCGGSGGACTFGCCRCAF